MNESTASWCNRGSIRLLSDAGGAIVESYTYLAFGQPTVMTNAGIDGNWPFSS